MNLSQTRNLVDVFLSDYAGRNDLYYSMSIADTGTSYHRIYINQETWINDPIINVRVSDHDKNPHRCWDLPTNADLRPGQLLTLKVTT